MTTEHFLERLTWPEVEARLAAGVDAVLLPIGTTEQHGRHMPLDTDCVIARGLAARAAEAGESAGVSLLVAPTLDVTLSGASGVVGDATRATGELGERIMAAVVPQIVPVAREMSGKEPV